MSGNHYLTMLEVEIVCSDARNQTPVEPVDGSKVTLGAVKHCEVAAVGKCGADSVRIEDAHRGAGVLVHVGALVHPVHEFVP